MAKKPGLAFERHQEIAKELKTIRLQLLKLSIEMSNAYPVSGDMSLPGKHLLKASRAIDSARCWAEENLFREYPDRATIYIYFGSESNG